MSYWKLGFFVMVFAAFSLFLFAKAKKTVSVLSMQKQQT
jgi:hypothetical protein